MRRLAVAIVVVAAACGGKKPDPAQARKACEHMLQLTWDAKRHGPIDDEAIDSCAKQLHHDSSAKQADCLIAAKTPADIDACGD